MTGEAGQASQSGTTDASASSSSSSSTAPPPPSPCLIHSGLYPRPTDYFPSSTTSQEEEATSSSTRARSGSRNRSTSADSAGTDTTTTRNLHRRGPRPSHRGPRGAAEPESGDDEDEARHREHLQRRPSTRGQGSSADILSASESSLTGSDWSGSETTTDDEDDDKVRSLTRQLAETAVGVREMSKQLGRARVKSTISSVLIITKARDNNLIKLTRELALFLMLTPRNGRDRGIIVYVDSQLKTSKRFDADGIRQEHPHLFDPYSTSGSSSSRTRSSDSPSPHSSASSSTSSSSPGEGQLRYWTADMCSRSPHLFDFVVTLGGDGTVLFCSWLFQRIVPPVLPFALGSLGFLTSFDFSDYPKVMSSAIDEGVRVNLRMRFTATVYRATLPTSDAGSDVNKQRRRAIKSGRTGEIIMRNVQEGGWERIEKPQGAATLTVTGGDDVGDDSDGDADDHADAAHPHDRPHKKDREVMCFSTRPVETFEVLNDLVVDRGPSPYVSQLEVFGDEHHMTTVQADGLCVSTPTGSTAYSLSAGGSLVHPEIPAILITPICPHTLSFRPMLLPDSMELRIAVPYNSRSTAWASFDGRGRVELKQGDHIKVTASRYPFPTVCQQNQSTDWFQSISRTLKWNERQRQKSFVVVEEGGESGKGEGKRKRSSRRRRQSKPTAQDESPTARDASSPTSKTTDADADADSDDYDDDSDDDADDDEKEEAFDIDDTSTVTTAANTRTHTPVPNSAGNSISHPRRTASSNGISTGNAASSSVVEAMTSSMSSLNSRHSHHHHHHTPHSAPTSHRSSFSRLSQLVPEVDSGIEFDAPPPSSTRFHEVRRRPSSSRGRVVSAAVTAPSAATPEATDNADNRFSAAGPPDPPRALGRRHLTTADFRCERVEGGGGKKERSRSRSRSRSKSGK